ncbi:MAG: hypothetical protein QM703_17830 [Gemmatales bacterium]
MKKNSTELWKTLKVGDRIRLVEVPTEFFQKGYYIHKDTLRVYKKLQARRRPLRVYQIDEYGFPWVRCMFQRKDGRCEWHYLAFNHSGIAQVKKRKPK